MMKRLSILAFGLFFMSLFSCHKTTKVELIEQIRSAPSYKSTLSKCSKSTQHYYFTDVEFFITAAYKSLPLRLAYMKVYTQKFKLTQEEQRAMYEKELAAYNNSQEFFVTVFSSKEDINNLGDEKKWRLFLEGEGTNVVVKPVSIEEIKADSVVRYFYPFVTPWTSNFVVKFPKSAGVGISDLNFMMASINGEQTFKWNLAKIEK